MICIGIDCGLTGALAVIYPTGEAEVRDMPVATINGRLLVNPAVVADILRGWTCGGRTLVMIENQQARPEQGRTSIYSLGRSAGIVEGVCATIGLPYETAPPARWKKMMGLSSAKEDARGLACRLFPLLASELARKKDHGRAEALLLAEIGRRQSLIRKAA